MNKLFTKIAKIFLGLSMAAGVGVAVASGSKEATPVHAASDTLAMSSQTSSDSNITAVAAKSNGSNAPITATVNSHSGVRMYANNTLTISSSQNITSLTIPWYKNGSKAFASVSVQSGGGTYTHASSSGNSGTWTGSSKEIVLKVGSSGQIQLYQIQYVTAAAKTLSSISVSGYTTSFTVGDAFSFGGTVTASYSDSSSSNVTSSTTFSGYNMSVAGNYTVTASYTEGGVTKTATYSITVSAPSNPFITPAKASTSGYTGQNESLSFTYGNLTGSLSVTSSNTSVVTVGTPSTSAGSGTVQINFVAEGSTTVKFKDGSTELASVSVSVSDPTVTITGMPSARSIATGATLNLGSLITVTPSGNLSSDVTWSTSNSSFASVTQSGVVTGEAVGSATITVTPDDYPAGAVSCIVTVANVMTAVFGTTRSNSSAEITDASKYKTDYSYTIDTNITLSAISKVYPQASNALKFGSSSAVGSMTFSIPSTIDSKPVYITSVTVRAERHHETNGTTMLIGGVEKVLTYSADDYTADLSSGEVTSFVLTADSSSSDKRMYVQSVSIQYAFKKTLSSIALSGSYQTTFTKGGTFNHDGLVVTATYSDSSTADVTSSATFSGYDLSNTGNQTVTVSYTEGTTKTATYPITVNYAAVSSLSLASNTGKVALNEYFDMSEIGVTILPSNANQGYEWTVLSNTVNDDFEFDADIVTAKDTAGTITLKCTSTADSSKYQTFVLTVSGNPVVTLPNSVTLYTGKTTTVTASVEGGTSPYSYSWSITSGGGYASISSGGSSATVTLSGSAAGSVTLQCSVTDSNSKSDSASVTFSVITSAVTEVNWSASAFDVFSGATIPSNIDDTWEVNYEKNNGDADYITFGDYELYVGSKEITSLPYTFVAEDDGKSLHVEYGGISSSSVAVTVTQSINAVSASLTDSWDHTFTTKAWSAAGDWTISEKSWTMSGTDDGTPYFGYDATKGQQFGSGSHPYSDVSLQSSAFSGTIDSVTVYTSGANSINATVQVSVGGTAYGSAQTITNTNTAYTFDLGGKSGTISIDWVNSSSKAIYVKEIVVNTVSGSENIANNASHKAAQRAAVKFAQAFNLAVANGNTCSTEPVDGGSSAWTSCQTAYSTFLSEASSDLTYAKNLLKYAEREYSDNSDEACIERMMKTYEILVGRGYTAFMSEFITVNAPRVSPVINIIGENTNTVAIIVIISMVSVTAIGGYFFLRKKKEQ